MLNLGFFFVFFSPGEDVAPAAAHPRVLLGGGGVGAAIETKGGATAPTGHAAGTEGNTSFTPPALKFPFFKSFNDFNNSISIFSAPFTLKIKSSVC